MIEFDKINKTCLSIIDEATKKAKSTNEYACNLIDNIKFYTGPDTTTISNIVANYRNYTFNDGYQECHGNRLLHTVVANKHLQLTQTLINTGVDINIKNDMDMTSLYLASCNQDCRIISLLINAGANFNQCKVMGRTLLSVAILNKSLDLKKAYEATSLLIALGADINERDERSDQTPLHRAVKIEAHDIIQLLIATGADTTIQNNEGKTPRMNTNDPATLRIFDQAVAAKAAATKSTSTWSWFYRSKN